MSAHRSPPNQFPLRPATLDSPGRTITYLIAPLLLMQALWVRLRTPRLRGAAGPTSGTVQRTGGPLGLIVLGESPVTGIGARTHEHAVTGRTAEALASRTDRTVNWQAFGLSGATARRMLREVIPQLDGKTADAVIIALGVNDVLAWRGPAQWTTDLEHLITSVRRHLNNPLIVLTGVPPMQYFPALPQPLRRVLGLRARQLDRASVNLAEVLPRVIHVPSDFELNREFFCEDGFHPSELGYAQWGTTLAEVIFTSL